MGRVLRGASEQWFKDFVVAVNGNGKKVIAQYLQLQKAAAAHGRPMQTISEIYTRDVLRQNGLSDAQIDQLDAAVLANRTSTASATFDSSTASSAATEATPASVPASAATKDDRGGVDLGPGAPIFIDDDLSDLSRAVLGGRR